MGFGHLDRETGKWVDDPEEPADDKEPGVPDDVRSVEVGDDGLVHPPQGEAEAQSSAPGDQREVDVGDDGLVRPSSGPTPAMSLADKARMIKAIQGGGDLAQLPAAPPGAAPMAPSVAVPVAPGSTAPLSPFDKAKLIRFVQSGQGSPADIANARSLLARSS